MTKGGSGAGATPGGAAGAGRGTAWDGADSGGAAKGAGAEPEKACGADGGPAAAMQPDGAWTCAWGAGAGLGFDGIGGKLAMGD